MVLVNVVFFVVLIAIVVPWVVVASLVVVVFVPFFVVFVEIPLLVECEAMYVTIFVEVSIDFGAHVVVAKIFVDRKFVSLSVFGIPTAILVALVV